MIRRLLRAASVLSAIAALPALACSQVEGATAWPQGRGIPRSVRPIVFNVFGRVERLLLLDVGPVSEPAESIQGNEDTPSARLKVRPDSQGTPVAVDVRVLVKPHGIAIVEIVPWAGRPLPARRKFQIVDPDIHPREGRGPSPVLGQFETGDAYEEERASLDRIAPQGAKHYQAEAGVACNCGVSFFSFHLAPASPARRAFAVWLYGDSPGAPPTALVLSQIIHSPSESESVTIEKSTGIPNGQAVMLLAGERTLVLRERRMNGSYGPAFRFRVSIPRGPRNGSCEGA
jgi:hypothetical protein